MSLKIIGKAFDLPLKANDKIAFLALCEYANDDDFTCYPSWKTLERKTSMSRGALSTCLNVLENLGLISREMRKRDNGSNTSNLWTVHVDAKVDWEFYRKNRQILTKKPDQSSESELGKKSNQNSESELGSGGQSSESELLEPLAYYYNPQLEKKQNKKKTDKQTQLLLDLEANLKRDLSSKEKAYMLDYIKYRKEIKKPIKTYRPLKAHLEQLLLAKQQNKNIDALIQLMKDNEWQTVKAEWLRDTNNNSDTSFIM
jgi:uncharacterized protein YbgA (DUF1722 family)